MITATFRLCHCILSVCAISPSRQTESCVERDIPASEFSFEHHIGQTRQQSFSDLDKDHVLSINSRIGHGFPNEDHQVCLGGAPTVFADRLTGSTRVHTSSDPV